MPQITRLSLQKNQKRVNVFVDAKFAFALPAIALAKAGLAVGQEITEEEIGQFKDKDLEEKLYSRVLNFLSYRPRSEKEIKDYLYKKTYKLKEIDKEFKEKLKEKILKKLQKQKLVDDFSFADWWINQRLDFKFFGKQKLKAELISKGIKREIIDKVLLAVDREELLKLAKKLLEKKKRLYKRLTPRKLREKLIGHLKRRGFSWTIIETAIDDFFTKD